MYWLQYFAVHCHLKALIYYSESQEEMLNYSIELGEKEQKERKML